MMTACAFQLPFGRLYTFYSPKWIFLSSVALFEAGSLLCGVAPTSSCLIVGRAIAGFGSAGIFSGSMVVMVNIVPLPKRPTLQGFMGVVILISSIVGPLLGGLFTEKLSWRWCFYINLPIGGATIILILFFLRLPDHTENHGDTLEGTASVRKTIDQLDPIGTTFLLGLTVCLLLALQWGGSKYTWADARIIVLLTLFALLTICFASVQIWKQENATIPPRILAYRSVTASAFFAFCQTGSMTVIVFYLPTWFQAILHVDAIESGIRLLPLILAVVIASIMAGGFTQITGYYTPVMIACTVFMACGAGLMTTFSTTSDKAHWIGYQVLFGYGVGLGQQQSGMAAQVVLPEKDVPTGISLKFFGQQLGGAIFVSVAQNVFSNGLVSGLKNYPSIPNLNSTLILNTGATELQKYFPENLLPTVLTVYNEALVGAFKVALGLACMSLIGALLTEWKSIKGKYIKGA
jgi:MFS family permease